MTLEQALPEFKAGRRIKRSGWSGWLSANDFIQLNQDHILADNWEIEPEPLKIIVKCADGFPWTVTAEGWYATHDDPPEPMPLSEIDDLKAAADKVRGIGVKAPEFVPLDEEVERSIRENTDTYGQERVACYLAGWNAYKEALQK